MPRWVNRGAARGWLSNPRRFAALLQLAVIAGLLANGLPTYEATNHTACSDVAESVSVTPGPPGKAGDDNHDATGAADRANHTCCPVHCPTHAPGLSGSAEYPSPDPVSVALLSSIEQAPDLLVVLRFDRPPCPSL